MSRQLERPVKLTFPAREPGARRIMAGKLQVGHCLADWHMHWTAYLWAAAGKPGMGFRLELKGRDLAEVREAARKGLAETGPWWTFASP